MPTREEKGRLRKNNHRLSQMTQTKRKKHVFINYKTACMIYDQYNTGESKILMIK